MNGVRTTSPQLSARLAGFLYLLIILGALFIPFAASPSGISGMTLSGGALAGIERIQASAPLYIVSGTAQLLILACDIIVALLFFELLKPVSRPISLLAAWFRLIFTAIAGANLFNHFAVLLALNGTPYLSANQVDQSQALALFFLKLRTIGFDVALVFFGVHCVLLGHLLFRSTFFPRVLGLLLALGGGVAYLSNALVHAMPAELREALFPYVMLPAGIAELLLALWLMIFGVNASKWEAQANSHNRGNREWPLGRTPQG
jgi:hypothetical protein